MLLVLSILFYIYAPLIAFNDIHIFGNVYVRFGIIFILWFSLFLFFMLKPIMGFLDFFKSNERKQLKSLKREMLNIFYKSKRNYFIAIEDAKKTWKRTINLKKLPLIIIIGNEGAGKSSFINYSNIEYPLSDALQSYKKIHKSTNNFSLYISKNGALLDTEGNYFAQESFFNPDNTDEMPEDDLEKNKEFLIKKGVWKKFLNFLNKNIFYNKLSGVILVIDTQLFLSSPREYMDNLIRYLVKRVGECEDSLGLKLPIYIVFSKLDLIEGMDSYFNIFKEQVANRVLGVTIASKVDKRNLLESFEKISKSLLYAFMDKNKTIYTMEQKNLSYLFLKQLDSLFSLAANFTLRVAQENSLKNKSLIRGVYFTSAYQENVPRNYLLDAICEKYDVKKAPAKAVIRHNQQSYFVQFLLKKVILQDSYLNSLAIKNFWLVCKFGFKVLLVGLFACTLSAYFISKAHNEISKIDTDSKKLKSLFASAQNYNKLTINEKANLMLNLKLILRNYPNLFSANKFLQYPLLDISYKSFTPARSLYYAINEDVIKNTIIKEMEIILQSHSAPIAMLETLYMYKSLFKQQYLNKALLSAWIIKNWKSFEKYKIPKDDFLAGLEDLELFDFAEIQENLKGVDNAKKYILTISKAQRVYALMKFADSLKKATFYNTRDDIGRSFDAVFESTDKFARIERNYTKAGLRDFLKNIDENTDKNIALDSWLIDEEGQIADKKILGIEILNIYLSEYQQKWQDILDSLSPKKYDTKDGMLHQLDVLSKPENPLNAFIKIIGENTHLNDALLLNYAYSLGFPSADIKTKFIGISNIFQAYYDFLGQDSFLNSQLNTNASKIGIQNENDTVKNENTAEVISADIGNLSSKIIDFTQSSKQNTEEKINYILDGNKDSDDPFSVFNRNIATLPPSLAHYYTDLSYLSWKLIENSAATLFNSAWKSEIYTPFVNEISPFYPFNVYADNSLNMDLFKEFFGNQGTLNKFYQKYLSKVLIKKGGSYYLNQEYKSKINFSSQFLAFMNKWIIVNSMFDSNNNIKLNFFVQSVDLSSDFGSIDISYNDKSMRYDHTLSSSIQIIVEQFSKATEFKLVANDYNQNMKYQMVFGGEWAWFKFLREIKSSSIYFNNNKMLYFDLNLTPNKAEITNIMETLLNLEIPQNIM